MTVPRRLTGGEVARYLDTCPGELCDLVLELREFVLNAAPEAAEAEQALREEAAAETIKFNSLCYYKPDQPYGVIGGNICAISARDDCVHLGFIHGAFLPDPEGRLQGTAKAKRYIELRSSKDLRRSALEKLIRAAVAHQPG